MGFSNTLKSKQLVELQNYRRIIQPRSGHFDSSRLYILNAIPTETGLLIFYYTKKPFLLGVVLVDPFDLKTILWRTSNPIWKTEDRIIPLEISTKNKTVHFNYTFKKQPFFVKFSLNEIMGLKKLPNPPVLKRTPTNPILKPLPHNNWESTAVFNSGALYLDNQVHFIYRAIMASGESVLGYAASHDGINIHERSNMPIYLTHNTTNIKNSTNNKNENGHLNKITKNGHLALSPYMSGSSWCGCEDPRLTQIEDTIYMTYTAWNYSSHPHVALTSIKVTDFLNKQWNWKPPIQISPNYEVHKNWVLFPEKFKGKYAILHSLSPNILIEYLDNLDNNNICIKSYYNPDKRDRDMYWDNWIRGAGPPPIKTSEGWLILYHAMDWKDPNRYKIGAMLLDLDDPTKVLYRNCHPILEPDAIYENQGHKAGVVYTCGAVILRDKLFVYYGAADTVLCAAYYNLRKLLSGIKTSQIPLVL